MVKNFYQDTALEGEVYTLKECLLQQSNTRNLTREQRRTNTEIKSFK